MESTGKELPGATSGDHLHLGVKAALSAIPVVGGPAAELFATIIVPPLAKRRDKWVQSLFEELVALKERVDGFDPELLSDREEFISATMQATTAAMRTHQQEKLAALRHALLNIALARVPDEDEQAIFLSHIDSFTGWHLRMLRFFEAPLRLAADQGARTDYAFAGSLGQVLEDCFPELRGRRDFYDQLVVDLNARGFLNSGNQILHTMMSSSSGLAAKRTTELADRFLKFINRPVELDMS